MSLAAARPRPLALVRVTLVQHRRALLWWAFAIAVTALFYASLYPSVRDSGDTFDEYLDQLPEAFRAIIGEDLTSPAGYLWSQLFGSMGPIVFLVYSIGVGARAIAGDEESGALDLVLSTPMRRATVLRDRALAMIAGTVVLSTVLAVALAITGPPFDMSVPMGDLVLVHVMQALLAIAFGSIALAIGAATGNRALAIGLTSAYAVVSYLVWAIGGSVDVLARALPLSAFRWFAEPQPLSEGTQLVNVLVLVAIAAAAYAVAHVTLQRRDLGT